MRLLGSMILRAADEARVAAGSALAVDRDVFSARVDELVRGHPLVRVVRDEATELPGVGIVATGPLTSDALAAADRKSTRLNSSHKSQSRMPSSA